MIATVRVADLAEQIRGVTYGKDDASPNPISGYLPVLRAGNITNEGLTFDDLVFVPAKRISAKQKIRQNDILIAASSGSLDVVGKAARALADYEGGFGAFCKVLRPGPDVDPAYFSHYFRTPVYRQRVSALAAGANINNLRNEHLDEMTIPLPPLPEQKRIAAILDQADGLRAKRRAALAQLDELTQAIFLEMFGDPATNPKGWPTKQLETEIDSVRYGTGSPPPYVEKGVPFIRATNVKAGTVSQKDLKHISRADAQMLTKCRVRAGNLIVVRSGVNTGDCAIVPPEFDGACAAFDLIVDLSWENAVFYSFLINSEFGKRYLEPLTRRAAQPHLNAEQFKTLSFISPEKDAKEQFAKHVVAVHRLKAIYGTSLAELNALFASLQHRAFRGELDG